MFTGIVSAIGVVRARQEESGRIVLAIESPWMDLELGESIAVDGACLTVVQCEHGLFSVDVLRTTLTRTFFGECQPGRRVNLERAMRLGDRLGGHLVQGHVDGVGTVLRVEQAEGMALLEVEVPEEVARVTIPLGSISLNGVSLTANALPRPGVVQLSLVPFTLEQTTLGALRPGDRVHLEGDLIGKHVRQQTAVWQHKGDVG